MHDPSITNSAYQSLTDQQLAEMDELCERFEQELVNGRGPRIETFLAEVPEAARDGLLVELLAMEFEYRTQQGDKPESEEYLRRFPQRESVIAPWLARQAAMPFPGRGAVSNPVDVPPALANFRLIEVIGRGGMGVVWLAEQDKPVKRRVALKLIKSEVPSQDVIARFEAEKQALAMMDHPHIARVLDAGTTSDDRPYFVMELVDGTPITRYCDDNKLSVDERLTLFVAVCKAVQHAHQKGVVHRDLKPSNVLVTVIDGTAVPKIIDFGLAKAVARDLRLSHVTMQTEFGRIVGTVQYMSPEQSELKGADAGDIDTRTDVYSLGVILYELLTGSTPLDEKTLAQNALLRVLEIIREEDPPRPSNRLSSSSHHVNVAVGDRRGLHPTRLKHLLKGELDWVVMKALEKDRGRRYQTANDLARDLSHYLAGETVAARPPSTWYQLRKFASRNRGLVAGLLAIGIVLLAGTIGTTYGLIQATDKAEFAKRETGKAQRNEQRAREAEKLAETESRRARDSEAAAEFQLANARWETNRPDYARKLLQGISPEYRDNYEWNFCNRHFQGSDITCYGHTDHANYVVFSPDGARIASASTDMTVRIWDAVSGAELATLVGHAAPVVTLAFSPDGAKLASGSDDGTLRLWDSQSGKELQSIDKHAGSVRSVAFSPDGTLLASGSDDHTIRMWECASDRTAVIQGHRGELVRIAFSPDGAQLVSAARDNRVIVWDVRDLGAVKEIRTLGADVLTPGICFSPDGTRIAAGSSDSITIWDADSGREMIRFLAHASWVNDVRFSPDATQVASCGDDKVVRLWDSRTGQEIASFTGHSQRGMAVAFSPNGERLASASHDATVKLWDVRSFQPAISLRGHTDLVVCLAFDPLGKRLASASFDATIRLWDPVAGEEVMKLAGHDGWVRSVVFRSDGKLLASGGADNTIRFWDSQSGQQTKVFTGHEGEVRSVAFSPDGALLASGSVDKTVKLWDVNSGHAPRTFSGHAAAISCVAFNPDGSLVASASDDHTIRVWNVATGKEVRTLRGHQHVVSDIAFSPDGAILASASGDHSIKFWDVDSGRVGSSLAGHLTGVSALAFSPNGMRLASTSWDRTLKLWDTQTGQELATIEKSHVGVFDVVFAPDGEQIAVACADSSIHLWPAMPNQEVTTLTGHENVVHRVTFGRDGKQIYSESSNEQLVWDAATGRPIQNAAWDPPDAPLRVSPNGRWFLTSELNHVLLVDREFRNTPHERAYRAAKARFDPEWHVHRATLLANMKSWYPATFHFAGLVNHDPEQSSYWDGLQASFPELQSQFRQQGRDLEPHLATVVRKTLKLPPRDEFPNPGFERPEIRAGKFEMRTALPGWKTSGELFEIWSTGFQGVEAHEGKQFVELNASEEATLYRDFVGIERDAVLEFSFAHRGRNGEDILKMTITDLGVDNALGGGDDQELFAKEYATGKSAWAVYDSTTEPTIAALGNKLRFAFSAVYATGGKGPDNTEGNFLDAACFGVGVATAKGRAHGVK